MIQPILSVIGDVKIFPTIVIIVSYAYALTPAGAKQACFLGYVRKRSVVIVTIEVICWRS